MEKEQSFKYILLGQLDKHKQKKKKNSECSVHNSHYVQIFNSKCIIDLNEGHKAIIFLGESLCNLRISKGF